MAELQKRVDRMHAEKECHGRLECPKGKHLCLINLQEELSKREEGMNDAIEGHNEAIDELKKTEKEQIEELKNELEELKKMGSLEGLEEGVEDFKVFEDMRVGSFFSWFIFRKTKITYYSLQDVE